MEQCCLFQLHVDFRTIVTNCGGNVAKAFNTPPKDTPITNPKIDESDENEGEEGGGYVKEDDRLTRVLALRAPVDTRWNSLY